MFKAFESGILLKPDQSKQSQQLDQSINNDKYIL